MAEQLALVKRDDFTSDVSVLNLLSGDWLADQGWEMSLGDGSEPVDEALMLHVPGTSDNDLAANVQALDAMLAQVKRFENPLEPYGVWLRTQLPGETNARQALILEAKRDKAMVIGPFAQQKHMLREYILGLKRTSAWEAIAKTDYHQVNLETIGGMESVLGVGGDLSARLARVTIEPAAWTEPLTRLWLGFRSDRFGNAGYFTPRWDVELGTLGTGAAVSNADDATATGGTEQVYTAEVPTLADDAFAVLHTPVKPTSITLTATIDGTDYTLTDALGDGALTTTPSVVADEELDPGATGTLNNVLIVPGSVLFKNPGDDSEICHDDGAGNLRDPLNAVVGAIVYATGAWTTTDPVTAEADYEYGLVEATIDYNVGVCTFTTNGVTAVTITYTSYINRTVRVTFTDPTLKVRWSMSVSDASAHPVDQAGKMLVIGRMKVSDGSTVCRVRLESGFAESRAFHNRSKVVVSGDEWTMYPLGYVSFPETGRALSNLDAIGNQQLRLSAELYAGTGTLEFDCLIMIPVDEGFIGFEASTDATIGVSLVNYPVTIAHSADNKVTAIGTNDSGDPIYNDITAQVIEGLPIGTSVYAVCAAQRYHASVRFDTLDLTIEGYERWFTLRGVE
jgi:hypothetical protein